MSTTLALDNPYDVSSIPMLEAHVAKQATEGSYDFEANKLLLKLYSVYPDASKSDVIAKVLALAMMRLPSSGMLALSYLVPGKKAIVGHVKALQYCSECLENARFVDFWEERSSAVASEICNSVVGFDGCIRSFIMTKLQDTYRTIDQTKFQSFLSIHTAHDLEQFCSSSKQIEKVHFW